jgi:quercetin dioxygenase-like cupin family protein
LGLNVTLKEITDGTEQEKIGIVTHLRKRDKTAEFTYSDKALARILTSEKQPFMASRLTLQPRGKTNTEQDPVELGRFEKFVYCLKGRITCVVGKTCYTLKKDDTLCFESNLPHWFENPLDKLSICLIVQNPRHI